MAWWHCLCCLCLCFSTSQSKKFFKQDDVAPIKVPFIPNFSASSTPNLPEKRQSVLSDSDLDLTAEQKYEISIWQQEVLKEAPMRRNLLPATDEVIRPDIETAPLAKPIGMVTVVHAANRSCMEKK